MGRMHWCAAVLLTGWVTGCGTAAEIRTSDGRTVEGTIVGADARNLQFETGATMPRADIIDIDHPGNGAAVTGLALVAYGIVNGLYVMKRIDNNEMEDATGFGKVIAFSPAAVGGGRAPWGYFTWKRSVAAADSGGVLAAPIAPPATTLVPFTTRDGDTTAFGALWGGQF